MCSLTNVCRGVEHRTFEIPQLLYRMCSLTIECVLLLMCVGGWSIAPLRSRSCCTERTSLPLPPSTRVTTSGAVQILKESMPSRIWLVKSIDAHVVRILCQVAPLAPFGAVCQASRLSGNGGGGRRRGRARTRRLRPSVSGYFGISAGRLVFLRKAFSPRLESSRCLFLCL